MVATLSASGAVVFTGDELIRRGFRTLGEVLAFEAGFVRERAAGASATASTAYTTASR